MVVRLVVTGDGERRVDARAAGRTGRDLDRPAHGLRPLLDAAEPDTGPRRRRDADPVVHDLDQERLAVDPDPDVAPATARVAARVEHGLGGDAVGADLDLGRD